MDRQCGRSPQAAEVREGRTRKPSPTPLSPRATILLARRRGRNPAKEGKERGTRSVGHKWSKTRATGGPLCSQANDRRRRSGEGREIEVGTFVRTPSRTGYSTTAASSAGTRTTNTSTSSFASSSATAEVAAGASPASISARTGVTPCELRISGQISAVSSSVVGLAISTDEGKVQVSTTPGSPPSSQA